ncbi:MLP1_5 [Sanghuangporus weigelae]
MKVPRVGLIDNDQYDRIDPNDVQALKDEIEDLQIDLLKDLSDEKERLASQAAAATSSDSNAEVESLKTQLAAAAQEKETSAKLLADEMSKAAKAAADHEAALSALREERDKSLAEKASLIAANEKLRAELQNLGTDAAEMATRHAEELRVLEARLTAKHEEELKAAIERTRKEAK